MSMRIHVVGAYGATDAEFRAALDLVGGEGRGSAQFRIGSCGRWTWASASVWHVNGADIDQALGSLLVPALRVTSSDAVLWMLTLTRPDKDCFHGVHHFTLVGRVPEEPASEQEDGDEDFPEDELVEIAGINRFIPTLEFLWDAEEEVRLKTERAKEAETTVPFIDDYLDYGVSLSPTVIQAMKRDPHRAWHIAFMAHASQIVEALEDYGFDFDRAAMRELVTVGPLTDLERDSDIGNMPRFLWTLGIDGVFREADKEEPADVATPERELENDGVVWSEYPPGQLFEKFDRTLAGCPLTEISGGPVEVNHAALLHLLSHLLAEDPATYVLLEFPRKASTPTRSWAELNSLEVRHQARRWQLCFETPHWWHWIEERSELASNGLSRSFTATLDGTGFEIAFMVAGLAEKCHRYAGTSRHQKLHLDRAYPSMTSSVLKDALGLVDQVFGSKPIDLASEDEVNAVRRTYQRSQGEPPKIRNGKIKPEYGSRDEVVQTLLFERFGNRSPWDIAAARGRVEADWQEYEQLCHPVEDDEGEELDPNEQEETSDELSNFNTLLRKMSEAAEQFKQARIVPHTDEVIYEGRTGKFVRASMSDLPHISKQLIQEHDAALESLGFQSIGDSTGDVDQRQEITRCYAGHPQAVSLLSHRNANNQLGWAAVGHGLMSVDFSNGTSEFHTHFDDGSILVTTSIDAVKSKPEVGIYVRCYEENPITKLWEKHLDGICRFKTHRGKVPIDHTSLSDPARFLAKIDDLFCRFLGLL